MNNCFVKYSITFFLFSFLLISCKKYPEDGKWSRNTVKQRIINSWQLKECLVDGIDLIDIQQTVKYVNPANQMIDSIAYTLNDFSLDFQYYKTKVNGKSTEVYNCHYSVQNILYGYGCICAGSEWKLIEKKNKLEFSNEFKKGFGYGANTVYINLLYNETNEVWDIRKLTDKELILETTNSFNKKVKLKFNRL